MSDVDIDALLSEIRRENDLRFAYIAGVGKGLDMSQEQWTREEFRDELRESFQEYVSELEGRMDE